jgi:hypothetical protein
MDWVLLGANRYATATIVARFFLPNSHMQVEALTPELKYKQQLSSKQLQVDVDPKGSSGCLKSIVAFSGGCDPLAQEVSEGVLTHHSYPQDHNHMTLHKPNTQAQQQKLLTSTQHRYTTGMAQVV